MPLVLVDVVGPDDTEAGRLKAHPDKADPGEKLGYCPRAPGTRLPVLGRCGACQGHWPHLAVSPSLTATGFRHSDTRLVSTMAPTKLSKFPQRRVGISGVISASMTDRALPPGSDRCREPGPEGNGRRPGDPDVLTSGEAAGQLNTTDDTIRAWVDRGALDGWWVRVGSRRRYFVPVTALANAPRPRRGPRRSEHSRSADDAVSHRDETQLAAIRSDLVELRGLIVSVGDVSNHAKIDQLSALVENLQTAGLRMKAAVDHMLAAQKAQSVANEHLMAAAQEQGEALAAFMLPQYPPNTVR